MTNDQIVIALRHAFHAVVSDHSLDPDVAVKAWSASQGRPRRRRLYAAVAATVVGVVGVSTALAITQTTGRVRPSTARPPATSSCTGNSSTGVLPTWGRSSYTDSSPGAASHIVGDDSQIIAVEFIKLRVHQPPGTHNKILWIARHGTGPGPLQIRARLEGSTDTVTRTVPLGPSYVDMPAPGCWLVTLQWSGRHDTLALRYLP